MKKILSIVLAVVLVIAMAVPVIAADETGSKSGLDLSTNNDFATKDVTIKTKDKNGEPLDPEDPDNDPADAPKVVYAVDVTFDSLEFTFQYTNLDATTITWDAENLCYVTGDPAAKVDLSTEAGSWDKTVQNIKIENRSNAKVFYKAGFTGGSLTATKNGVTATLATTGTGSLESAEGATSATLPTGTYTVTVSGKPTVLKTFVVDQVKVTLSKTAFN